MSESREAWTEKKKGLMSEVFSDSEIMAPEISGFGTGTFGEEGRLVFLVSLEGRGFKGTKDRITFFFDSIESVESMLDSLKANVEEYKKENQK